MKPVVTYVINGNVTDRRPLEMTQIKHPTSPSTTYFFESYKEFRRNGYICLETHPCYGNGILLAI